MKSRCTNRRITRLNMLPKLLCAWAVMTFVGGPLGAAELPPELKLWEPGSPESPVQSNVEEQVRSGRVSERSLSGMNRAFSAVSVPTYCIHRPERPNGVGLVICPGGGFRDVWIDREGHDLALWLQERNVTCLVLKYRTRTADDTSSQEAWQNYQRAVRADGGQAVRILRKQASELGLQPNKIGICGFSAGGHLAISCALHVEPKLAENEVSGMPDFAGLFYPGIPDDVAQVLESRMASEANAPGICPMFIVNARVDKLTPAEKCVDFYASLLRAGVNAELHVFSKGSHGFGMGGVQGTATSLWPTSFTTWLHDCNIIPD